MTDSIGVLHLVDSLDAGGAEQMAVMLANSLPVERYAAWICASRKSGSLETRLAAHVNFYNLQRRGRFDLGAILRLARLIRQENIRIIHAHTTSLFLGTVICFLNPRVQMLWHDHFGRQDVEARSVVYYRPFASRTRLIFTVTRRLRDWAIDKLEIPGERVVYLPNFVDMQVDPRPVQDLPGVAGKRLVCVANIRRQKDHLSLVSAMATVVSIEPLAHLILVGAETDMALSQKVKQKILDLGLTGNITFLGPREDVPAILAGSDIGVLASVSEGFPVALLEYGRAGLACVATRVGEIEEILNQGEAGLLVSPSAPAELAAALVELLKSPGRVKSLGLRLHDRVAANYSAEVITQQVCGLYEEFL